MTLTLPDIENEFKHMAAVMCTLPKRNIYLPAHAVRVSYNNDEWHSWLYFTAGHYATIGEYAYCWNQQLLMSETVGLSIEVFEDCYMVLRKTNSVHSVHLTIDDNLKQLLRYETNTIELSFYRPSCLLIVDSAKINGVYITSNVVESSIVYAQQQAVVTYLPLDQDDDGSVKEWQQPSYVSIKEKKLPKYLTLRFFDNEMNPLDQIADENLIIVLHLK